MNSESDSSYSYDRLPYASYAYANSHPGNLSMLAQLFGMSPAKVDDCRVLEIGSASGGNLIPIALQFPNSDCLGIDASERQIDDGQQVIAELGLKNIRLEHLDVLDFDPQAGPFDYIICHGVYSWVPPNVQTKILDVCRDHLAENGVAYISYNTYPGWYLRRGVREMMAYHASGFDDEQSQINQSRALVDFLVSAVKPGAGAYEALLHEELNILKSSEDSYIYHEHLEDHNEPIFFHQFVSRAGQSDLRFLCEAQFSSMLPSTYSEETRATLSKIAPDIIQMEQYMDFVRNRKFRQTLLCHGDVVPQRSIKPERIENLFVSAPLRRRDPIENFDDFSTVVFEHGDGRKLTVTNPIQVAGFERLAALWPGNISIEELVIEVCEGRPAETRPSLEECRRELTETLLELFSSNLVSLWGCGFDCTSTIDDPPRTHALARYQSARGGRVTNLRHESVHLNQLEREIVRRLDGEVSIDRITSELLDDCVKAPPNQDGSAPGEGTKPSAEELRKAIVNRLERLAGAALLKG